jgi:ABC-type multidrug transport system ATPase subunit
MNITFDQAGKRFNREWIFRQLNYRFEAGTSYVILGSNGSGKSTLLQAISGYYSLSEGAARFELDGKEIEIEKVFRHMSIATPYLELYEDFSLKEAIEFHQRFKSIAGGLSAKEVIAKLDLEKTKDKAIKHFSSGMKHRVRLGLAILSETPVLLLDEPTSNLDRKGIKWYQDLIAEYSKDRIVVVCSNQQEHEYEFCTEQLNIEDFKPDQG